MSDLRQAAQQALEALESLQGGCTDHDDGTVEAITVWCPEVIDALRSALEQQQAEPVHGDIRALKYRIHELEGEVMGYKRMLDVAEAASQPQQQAEPPSEWPLIKNILDEYGLQAISFVAEWKAAQQQAEPMAWMDKHGNIDHGLDAILEPEGWKPLYTTPPQRKWVGLTDEDVNRESAMIAQQMKLAFHAGMYVAQKILKEKNNDNKSEQPASNP